MQWRGTQLRRCEGCLVDERHCFCEAFEPIDVQTAVVLVMHRQELAKPTNTGRLLLKTLPRVTTVTRAVADPAPVRLPEGARPLVLHPDARRELSRADASPSTVLIVPDGTWSQSRRMMARDPALIAADRVRLPDGPESVYLLRKAPHKGFLCTLEAVARALGVLEGEAIEQRLMALLHVMVERSMKTRGRALPDGYGVSSA
jgi:DTW domain-containing protein YfiP